MPKTTAFLKTLIPLLNPATIFFVCQRQMAKKNPIPGAYSSWGIGNVVIDDLRYKLQKINQDALKANAEKGSNTQKIGDFYFSGLDTVNIEKLGVTPLKDELARIDKINSTQSLIDEFAHLETIGVPNPIGAYVGQDDKNSVK
jgi:putative endopeptidase